MAALLDPKQESFARHMALGKTKRDSAVAAGYSEHTASSQGSQLAKRPIIAARIAELQSKAEEKVIEAGAKLIELEITSRTMRLAALNERYRLMEQIRQERANDPTMQAVPGGKTGLIVRQLRAVGFGKQQRIVPEYSLDAAMLKEIRAHEQQAATELGEWNQSEQTKETNVGRVLIGLPDEDEPLETKPLNADALRAAGKSLSVQ